MKYINIIFDILNINYWQDIIEIILISMPIYYFLIFLKNNKEPKLLLGFYLYLTIFFLAYIIPFNTIQPILWHTLPITILLFIILHENNIQKNLITYKKIYAPNRQEFTGLEDLARCSLYALNKNKEVIFVIERENDIKNLINIKLKINADLSKDIFEVLMQKHLCSEKTFLLLNQIENNLKIISINNTWNLEIFKKFNSIDFKNELSWKDKAILVTSKTDTIIFKVNSLIRTFDLIVEGKIINNLNAERLFIILSKYIKNNSKSLISKDNYKLKNKFNL